MGTEHHLLHEAETRHPYHAVQGGRPSPVPMQEQRPAGHRQAGTPAANGNTVPVGPLRENPSKPTSAQKPGWTGAAFPPPAPAPTPLRKPGHSGRCPSDSVSEGSPLGLWEPPSTRRHARGSAEQTCGRKCGRLVMKTF